ncbi:multidrug resistance efflux transporter family protein [Bacillus licheniformis]|nr:multidrug resistance efflux transporter family protein [Bacillus licheniformis]
MRPAGDKSFSQDWWLYFRNMRDCAVLCRNRSCKGDMRKLAAVEATQSFEVLFAAAGEILILSSPLPGAISWSGMALVIIGMVLNSHASNQKPAVQSKAAKHKRACDLYETDRGLS